tara:strand:+ start:1267 stop:1542 length:276 start_codon:yes stop_codon:yes gene_type:complete
MTNPTTTELLIDVDATLANIFGCPNDKDQISQLCAVSDWAANTRFDLEVQNRYIELGHDDHHGVVKWLAQSADDGLWSIPGIVEMIEWVEA